MSLRIMKLSTKLLGLYVNRRVNVSNELLSNRYQWLRHYARISGGVRRPGSIKKDSASRSPPTTTTMDPDPWKPVKDVASGQIYWWNINTNETTTLGAPKPANMVGAPPPSGVVTPPQQGGMMSGLAGVVAEGFAFGTGSALAHRAVGSFFGSGSSGESSSSDNSSSEGSGDDDSWDI